MYWGGRFPSREEATRERATSTLATHTRGTDRFAGSHPDAHTRCYPDPHSGQKRRRGPALDQQSLPTRGLERPLNPSRGVRGSVTQQAEQRSQGDYEDVSAI